MTGSMRMEVLGDRVEPGQPTGLIDNPNMERSKRGWKR